MNHPTHPEEVALWLATTEQLTKRYSYKGHAQAEPSAPVADLDEVALARFYTHPEDVVFAGLVMGREAPEPESLFSNLQRYRAEVTAAMQEAALAATARAQPASSDLALQELTTLIRHHTDPEAFQEIRQALLAFNQTAHPIAQPAVPVTDAEVKIALSASFSGSDPIDYAWMRTALEAFLASRGQA